MRSSTTLLSITSTPPSPPLRNAYCGHSKLLGDTMGNVGPDKISTTSQLGTPNGVLHRSTSPQGLIYAHIMQGNAPTTSLCRYAPTRRRSRSGRSVLDFKAGQRASGACLMLYTRKCAKYVVLRSSCTFTYVATPSRQRCGTPGVIELKLQCRRAGPFGA